MKIWHLLLPCCVLSAEDVLSSCSFDDLPTENVMKFHGDDVCDRGQYNPYQIRMNRHKIYERLKSSKEINQVPNQKTVYCPLEVQDLLREGQEPQVTGFNSFWIVENTSKEPIVLSSVNTNGTEYSAVNPSITPPQEDPEAILSPSQWRAIFAHDGNVFHARSYDPQSGNLGPVLLQHRVGLIPVGAKSQDLPCSQVAFPEPVILKNPDSPPPVVDPPLLVNPFPENVVTELSHRVSKEVSRDPQFQRTPPVMDRPCNAVDIGFRNMANCPLHGYYVHRDSCQEQFRFHLGKNPQPHDFVWNWDSPTKFEGSYMGHSFVFRLAANPDVLVETVTLQPTRIIDCPELQNKAQINKVTKVGDIIDVSLPLTVHGDLETKRHLLEDRLIPKNRQIISRMFNQTFDRNETVASQRKVYSSPMESIMTL